MYCIVQSPLIFYCHLFIKKLVLRKNLLYSQELVCPGAEARWSLAELIQAIVLMSHAHSLASFVLGCGVLPEPEQSADESLQMCSATESCCARDKARNQQEVLKCD